MKTLSQILTDANAYLDLEATEPTGTDLAVRINYAKQAVNEWGASYNWRQLNQSYFPSATTMASISLPSNFRRFTGAPRNQISSGVWQEYPEIAPEERYGYESTDYYCYILGTPSIGYTVIFNNLATNASLSIDYQRYPSNMATLTDSCEVDDGEYIKMKVISYVLQSRSDDRFPIVEAEAGRMLKNMIGREMITRPGGYSSTLKRSSSAYGLGRGRQ